MRDFSMVANHQTNSLYYHHCNKGIRLMSYLKISTATIPYGDTQQQVIHYYINTMRYYYHVMLFHPKGHMNRYHSNLQRNNSYV